MVSYERWIQAVFDSVKARGMTVTFENSSDVVTAGAQVWNVRKDEIQSATVSEAETIAEETISIS